MGTTHHAQEFVRESVSLQTLLQDGRDLSESECRLVDASLEIFAAELAPRGQEISLDASAWTECPKEAPQ
jgi:hypothetical protein